MTQILDGKLVSEKIQSEIAATVSAQVAAGGKRPHLAAVLVGNDGGSQTYVAHKVKACEKVGFLSTMLHFEADITQVFLLNEIEKLNQNEDIDGFIVQLPLPPHIDVEAVIHAIADGKDVDGFHPVNVGKMVKGTGDGYLPATPAGILELIKYYEIATAGKNCVVIGRSQIVGAPMSILLSQPHANATVTLCHSRTQNLERHTQNADIIITALGKPGFLTADMVKQGAVVIDVGTTRVPTTTNARGWVLKGDVDYDNVAPKCAAITPVPGGVGPMTIAMLLKNTLKASQKNAK
jgi:methylenetetrahydrofolate dehydrogenase (NADP+)/methenyltetrahydrofolate cyclohydrolase